MKKGQASVPAASEPVTVTPQVTTSCKAIEEARREGLVSSIQRCLIDPLVQVQDLESILVQLHRICEAGREAKKRLVFKDGTCKKMVPFPGFGDNLQNGWRKDQCVEQKGVGFAIKGMEIPDGRECTALKDLKTVFVVKKTGESLGTVFFLNSFVLDDVKPWFASQWLRPV